MKIELEEPFKSLWKRAYLRLNNQGRQVVDLVNDNSDRTTTSYARYLMGVKLGYIVPEHLDVDHIDDDKTNDSVNNLQLITRQQNITKASLVLKEERTSYRYNCAYCETEFLLTEDRVNYRSKTSTTGLAFCSRSCNAKYSLEISKVSYLSNVAITQDKINEINQLAGQDLSNYRISKLTGIHAATVAKYRINKTPHV